MVSRREPWLAVLLSLFTPGLGQLYAGRPKALVGFALLGQLATWLALGSWIFLPAGWLTLLLGFVLVLGVLLANIVHAARAASRAGPGYELRAYNRWYIYLAAYGLLGLLWQRGGFQLAKANLAEAFRIPSAAMEPTLLVGDFIFVAKAPRSLRSPQHAAIVVFQSVEDSLPPLRIVKRLLGLPGDTLRMIGDTIYRNGTRLSESYVVHVASEPLALEEFRLQQIRSWQLPHYAGRDPGHYRPTIRDWGPVVVPADSFFALGDNRDESYDSRFYGFVPTANIIGQPRIIYFSYGRDAGVRWNRIGREVF